MTQKQLFNLVDAPIFTPSGTTVGEPFHRLGEKGPDQLWSLHLWVCNNNWTVANAGIVALYWTEIGVAFSAATAANFLAAESFPNSTGVQPVPERGATVLKLADGLPVRGPIDLWVIAGGGNAVPANGTQAPSVFGYLVRGEGSRKEERRFFDPGSKIGDGFAGGAAVAVLSEGIVIPSFTDVHETDSDYIDDITLDMTNPSPVAADVTLGVAQFSAYPGPTSVPVPGGPGFAMVQLSSHAFPSGKRRLLDGLAARNAGTLQVGATGDVATTIIANGHFTRG